MIKENTYLIDSFEYIYPSSHKIVGIITEDNEEIAFHFKPKTEVYTKLKKKW